MRGTIKLIVFVAVLVAGSVLFIRATANNPSVRGQDPNIGTHAANTDGMPAGTSGSGSPAVAAETWAGDAAFTSSAAGFAERSATLAELASRRAASSNVRAFAAELERDHRAALASLRAATGAQPSAGTGANDPLREQALASLDRAQGDAFDQAWLDATRAAYEGALPAFESAAASASNPGVRAWAADRRTALEQHLQHARNLKGTVQ